jgi:hypothetical protein
LDGGALCRGSCGDGEATRRRQRVPRSSNGSPTFLNIGRDYPNPARFTVVIWIENRAAFGTPERRYRGRTICVRGLVKLYRGSPEVVARSPSQIAIAG